MKHPPKVVVVDWLNTVWETDLPYQSKYLACYLRKFMNSQHDMAWPSYSRMIAETGLSRATIAKYLTVLDEAGWIVRERGSPNQNTRYIVSFPQAISDLQSSLSSELGSSSGELGVVQEVNLGSSPAKHELNKVINNSNKQERGARDKFYMFSEWIPDKTTWEANCFRSGCNPDYTNHLFEFTNYWSSEQKPFTEDQWQGKLIASMKRNPGKTSNKPQNPRMTQQELEELQNELS